MCVDRTVVDVVAVPHDLMHELFSSHDRSFSFDDALEDIKLRLGKIILVAISMSSEIVFDKTDIFVDGSFGTTLDTSSA